MSHDPTPEDSGALAGFLADRDAPCPVCAYNLRGLTADVCPECAARLRLQVGSENLHVGPWALAVISLTLALGFDGVTCLILIGAFIFTPPPSLAMAWPVLRILVFLAALAAACLLGIRVLFRKRRAWHRLPLRVQFRWAVGLFVFIGLLHASAGAFMVSILR